MRKSGPSVEDVKIPTGSIIKDEDTLRFFAPQLINLCDEMDQAASGQTKEAQPGNPEVLDLAAPQLNNI